MKQKHKKSLKTKITKFGIILSVLILLAGCSKQSHDFILADALLVLPERPVEPEGDGVTNGDIDSYVISIGLYADELEEKLDTIGRYFDRLSNR